MLNYKLYYAVACTFLLIQLQACKKNDDLIQKSCREAIKPQDAYIYPVKPGTAQWNNLTSGDEKFEACQIPDSILSNTSTEGLIQSWLDFPLNNEILMANSIQRGVEFLIANFSGLKELCARNDSGVKLYERYQRMDPSCISGLTNDTDKGAYTFSFTYIEMLLGQDAILNKMTAFQKKALVSEAVNKYSSKNDYAEFGPFGAATSIFVCGRAMQNSRYQPFLTEIGDAPFIEPFLDDVYLPADKGQAEKVMKSILNNALMFIR